MRSLGGFNSASFLLKHLGCKTTGPASVVASVKYIAISVIA